MPGNASTAGTPLTLTATITHGGKPVTVTTTSDDPQSWHYACGAREADADFSYDSDGCISAMMYSQPRDPDRIDSRYANSWEAARHWALDWVTGEE